MRVAAVRAWLVKDRHKLRRAISGQCECQSVVALPALPYMALNGAVRT